MYNVIFHGVAKREEFITIVYDLCNKDKWCKEVWNNTLASPIFHFISIYFDVMYDFVCSIFLAINFLKVHIRSLPAFRHSITLSLVCILLPHLRIRNKFILVLTHSQLLWSVSCKLDNLYKCYKINNEHIALPKSILMTTNNNL